MSSGALTAQRFNAHCAALLDERRKVIVALSGGLDSVVLLHLLRFGSAEVELSAAHFDHAMRADSAADALWVRGLCRAWDVPLHTARAEDPPRSEAAARELRYAFLHAAADQAGASAILTAHHADDQAETVLFRLARGTGLAGLAGIAERRGRLCRPLLQAMRADLEQYARENRLRWRDDPSNRDLRLVRNRIRHRILPELERATPGATRRIARLARDAAAAERGWRRLLKPVLDDVVIGRDASEIVLARDRLLAYDPHVRARAIRHLLNDFGARPDRVATRTAVRFAGDAASGRTLEFRGGILLSREFERLHIRAARESRGLDVPLRIHGTEPGSGTFVAGGLTYLVRWAPAESAGRVQAARFDPSLLRFPLEMRAWAPGDRIRLDYGSKKLKKLLQEHRIGRYRRAAVPVLVDGTGEVLWVPGVARSAHARVTPGGAVLEITVVDGNTE
jgi:tRNA(Ile)-lysidine synthase